MGSIRRRLEALEEGRTPWPSCLSGEALGDLSDEGLDALEGATEAGVREGRTAFEDLHRVVGERSRRALAALLDVHPAVKGGEEPRSPPDARDYLDLIRRISAGDEDARRDWESRNGYRIWKYHKK